MGFHKMHPEETSRDMVRKPFEETSKTVLFSPEKIIGDCLRDSKSTEACFH